MRRFLKQFIKSETQFFAWTYIPLILTCLFMLAKVYFFPNSGMLSVGVFYVCTLAFVVYKVR